MSNFRSDNEGAVHRVPMRKRGVERFEVLLDATEALIADRTNDDVSLAQIAEKAGVPLASVYHFFPNRNAAFVALAERFHNALRTMAQEPLQPPISGWQEVVASRQRIGANYLNAHPAALRLFMGAGVSVDVRNTDLNGNADLARGRVKFLDHYFEMPKIKDLEKRIAISIALMDGIWALSYSVYGRITDEYVEESTRASVTYLRSFLPEFIEFRPGAFARDNNRF
ncbi:TetR family transcriptional regulator [Rhizobium sp. PP-F2F-G38]|uniref:TetR/AcrR family transcriptional regulator n=1 Tax=Rhizobium sp. PP-CC-3G-465 TaxID=2135648 RepID=UPI000D99E04A|nr:TetR family transcriptional regulator [Rhizobium sp. PP-WC-1G-195]PYE39497.1 TetR family transcriptional regulator [Rhizobium sp. PP-F2F-G20b]PYE93341.1 TetR family transcriptional regulator [Rhizobium sp. PP-F2F-G38]TCP75602.1 TetR family transcriptional regulator [Rhizobium sp. PP-CC-2G-626]TCQ02532.1 TetR family transcriptional regulator [Rhizobium sp. PP-F2F-G36]TCQ17250.1 TetR family transcriptional regulator [Rhizobium sp. PP-CC-3G-465]